MSQLPQNFCPIPWKHLYVDTNGTFKTCCRTNVTIKDAQGKDYVAKDTSIETVWKEGLKDLRQQFLNNERPSQCSACWQEEETNSVSLRKHWLDMYKKDFGPIDLTSAPENPASLDLWLNNVCNMKCRICGPHNSSKWVAENLDLKNQSFENAAYFTEKKFTGDSFETLKKWLPEIKKINFFGGEPFLGREQTEIVQAIIHHGNPAETMLSFNTNGTVINQSLMDQWQHFKHIHLVVSVDGVRERFHYQRFPGQWSSVVQFIDKVNQVKVRKLSQLINMTVSNFNVFYLDEVIEWVMSLGFKNWQLIVNLLHVPDSMSIGILPQEMKNVIAEKLLKINLKGNPLLGHTMESIVDFMMKQPSRPDLLEQFVAQTYKTDVYRKNDFRKTFPEFYELLKPYIVKNPWEPAPISQNFCPVPFTQIQVSSDSTFKPCCRYEGAFQENGENLIHPWTKFEDAWKTKDMVHLRQQFINGERPKQCRECWKDEAAGHHSLRIKSLKAFKPEELKQFVNNVHEVTPKILDIKLSNLCNLKCRICGPSASSTWEEEIRRNENPDLKINHDYILNSDNYKTFVKWLPQIDRIEIFGGEPLMNNEFYKILDLCIVHGQAHRIAIHCNSNATFFSTKYANYFAKFKSVSIYFSIDDIGERFTYQRNPAKWSVVTDNLKKYAAIASANTEFGINCTVSLFNVFYLPEFVKWAESQQFVTGFNLLHLPEYFSIVNLPEAIKDKIIERLEKQNHQFTKNCSSWASIINFLKSSGDSSQFAMALQEIKKIDQYRNQNFAETFPEFWSLINAEITLGQMGPGNSGLKTNEAMAFAQQL